MENDSLKTYEKWAKIVEEIERKTFRETRRGLLTKRVEDIENKTNLKVPKDKAKFSERICYLYGKIVGFGRDDYF